jgi:hypothetical protein
MYNFLWVEEWDGQRQTDLKHRDHIEEGVQKTLGRATEIEKLVLGSNAVAGELEEWGGA